METRRRTDRGERKRVSERGSERACTEVNAPAAGAGRAGGGRSMLGGSLWPALTSGRHAAAVTLSLSLSLPSFLPLSRSLCVWVTSVHPPRAPGTLYGRRGPDNLVVGLGARAAVSRHVQDDQPRVDRVQRLEAEARALGRARGEVLDEDIGSREHGVQQLAVGVALDVRHERLLAAVEPREVRRLPLDHPVVPPRKVARLALHLDHPRLDAAVFRRGESNQPSPTKS